MNKWSNGIVFALGLFVFLLPFSFVNASSGACSWHGGVDCSAGPGIYGQVICNDGWTGSSVSYSSMVECQNQGSDSYCGVTPSELTSNEAPNYISNALSAENGTLKTYQDGLSNALSQAKNFLEQAQQQAGNNSMLQDQAQADYDELVAQAHTEYDSAISQTQSCISYLNDQGATYCQDTEGKYAGFNASQGACTCGTYWLDPTNNQCETPQVVCNNDLGSNSHPIGVNTTNVQCVCNTNAVNGSGNYTVGTDGKCDPVQEPVHTISQTAYSVASGGYPCLSLSGTDKDDCNLYEQHTYDYTWQIISPNSSSNTIEQPTQTISAPSNTITPPTAQPTRVMNKVNTSVNTAPSPVLTSDSINTTTQENTDIHHSRSLLWVQITGWFSNLNPFHWFH